ncbi:ABC transporter ATP-binding protein [Leucobacter sp. OH2974_COT-288]|uniref:Peptide/nickel transport system ATP-binding protein n=1 Tax=Canibacter oris TaxID=1365628 RepID=A0A840DL36_9MICO|nr:ABC transporter ATP-binding protein [Canibacter oris]MBB4070808.1 peptide/nickel transport system ATP-binding protein [Canibacter oris]RRD36189.1 ABC transporter ATP-binding protein [Leucobacter sp. OH2974_COT-288]
MAARKKDLPTITTSTNVVYRHDSRDGKPILSFQDVKVSFDTEFGQVDAVKGVSFDVKPGEVVALVGESGSGKSVTSSTAMGLLPKNAHITGKVLLGDDDVLQMSAGQLRRLRGRRVAMVFQEPMTALNPVLTVGDQLMESLNVHNIAFGNEAKRRAVELLEMVGIPDAVNRLKQYPHQFSGGQRQRIVIAMALSCSPEVIIADEPTTALDVTVQAEILELLRSLKDKLNTGILLITHNMGVVADMADRVCVMLRGELVETGDVRQVMQNPQHPYTQRLLSAVPRLGETLTVAEPNPVTGAVAANTKYAVEANSISIAYEHRGKKKVVVHDVSFNVAPGEILGLVGESGSGKSTIAKSVLGLLPITQGSMKLYGRELTSLSKAETRAMRKQIGVVFQDPAASLDPRFPIGDIITEPMVIHGVGDKNSRIERAYELLDAVKLPRSVVNRYPHELSGGQRQRVSIARALTLDPDVLIADEPTSALDVSVQAAVLDMFAELQSRYEFACLFVSHDLAVVDMLAHKVLVLKDGREVEQGSTREVLHNPQADYTRRLLAAAPVPDPDEQRSKREERNRILGVSGLSI